MDNLFPSIRNYQKATVVSFYLALLIRIINNNTLYYYLYPSIFIVTLSGIILKTNYFKNLEQLLNIQIFTHYLLPFFLIYNKSKKIRRENKKKFYLAILGIVMYNIYIYILTGKSIFQIYDNRVLIAKLISILLLLLIR